MTVVPQPPYTQDFASCEFFLFRKLDTALKGMALNDVIMIQTKLWDIRAKFETADFRKFSEWWHSL
jgi:hypothetical protein